ncbi:MAG: hypothetical protein A2046_07355 [Bacteroidetes bacterium GWA2_30_7]|nr:MAG: hypothetical protein A2046_07355 [Bacteroidetes bacterium GWA2_30_7]
MILVTGGTGLLGSHLLFDLLKSNDKIIAIKRENSSLSNVKHVFNLYSKNADELLKKIEWRNADLCDYESIYVALNGVNKVYHCAAMVSYNKSDRNALYENNVVGTANIVNASLEKGIKKLCYTSSIAALGVTNDNSLITEKTYWDDSGQSSNYSISKYFAEIEVWRGIAEGLNSVIVNPSIILGSGIGSTSTNKLFDLVRKGLKYYTKGGTGFVDVRDVSNAMILLMESDICAESYIVNSENLSWKDFFSIVAECIGKNPPSTYASNTMTGLAWRSAYILSYFNGKSPSFTKETARTSHKILKYSNEKLINQFDFETIKIKDSIGFISKN